MPAIAHNLEELIGHTPLLELNRYGAKHQFQARVLAKLEYFNPAGSVKDRIAKEMLDDAAMAVMVLNGGSAVPLWNTWLDALQETAPEGNAADAAQLKAMFAHALEELSDMSGAQVGDKTMMDAFIPACEAIAACDGDEAALFEAAAQAARAGAENTRNFASKFGRAKSYGDKTIGTPDAGAVSMARFFEGLAQA